MTNKILYALLAVCVAALIYLKKWWENIDLQNLTTESVIILMLIVIVVLIGLIFVSPYIHLKLPFQEGKFDKKRLYGGKDIV